MILGVYGTSNSGKTTFVARLVRALREKGYSVATIKHAPHDDVTMDVEGTDTYKHAQAGAGIVIAAGNKETDVIIKQGKTLNELKHLIEWNAPSDIIIAEGYKDESVQKIRVGDIAEKPRTIATYHNDADFAGILAQVQRGIDVEKIARSLPGLNCGKCGYTCTTLAGKILDGDETRETCKELTGDSTITIRFNEEQVALGAFVNDIATKTIMGLISSLKGFDAQKTNTVTITLRRNVDSSEK